MSTSFTSIDTTNVEASPILEDGSMVEVKLKSLKFKSGEKDGRPWAMVNGVLEIIDLTDTDFKGSPGDCDFLFHRIFWPTEEDEGRDLRRKQQDWKLFLQAFEIPEEESNGITKNDEDFLVFADGSKIEGFTTFAVLKVDNYQDQESNVVKYFCDAKGNKAQLK